MISKDIRPEQAAELRRQAEDIARDKTLASRENCGDLSHEDIRQALHELRVHQIELEMQNEEMRTMQAALEATRAHYFDLYDMAPVGYCTLSEKGLILETNLTTVNLLGVPRSALVGQPLTRFICNEDQTIYYQHFKQLFETGNPLAWELRMVKKDGAAFWARLEMSVTRDSDGAPVRRVVISDITHRKQAEEDLRDARWRLESIIEGTHAGTWEWNIQTGETRFNETWAKIIGYSPDELSPISIKTWETLTHPDDLKHSGKLLERHFSGELSYYDCQCRMKHKDGHWIWVHDRGRVITRTADGKPLMMFGTHIDITDYKQAEAEKAKLEAQNRQLQKAESLGRMASAIAHHFNNQLSVVMGNLEMAMDDLPPGANSNENLVSAMQAVCKAADVSRLMLTYLGQTPGEHVPMDMAEVCRLSLNLLQAGIPKGIIINARFPASGPVISGNAGQIQQVLTNLITNAREAVSDNQDSIGLTVKTVSHADIPGSKRYPIDWQPQEIAHACLEVSDTGCGIPDQDIDKIFDPFFTTKFTGRGLGLAVVKGIVKAHGGGIAVNSGPGEGSVFRVFLPILTEERSCQPARSDLPGGIQADNAPKFDRIEGSGTVLLIEDEASVRNMTRKMLIRLGYTVLEATDGVEAVEIFKQHPDEIRCVLSDLTMPRMNGWDTLTALRKLSPDIPVILSSGYDEAQVLAHEHPERPNAFLGKPYQLKGLRDTIDRALTARVVQKR